MHGAHSAGVAEFGAVGEVRVQDAAHQRNGVGAEEQTRRNEGYGIRELIVEEAGGHQLQGDQVQRWWQQGEEEKQLGSDKEARLN